jgi:hypothetical protein
MTLVIFWMKGEINSRSDYRLQYKSHGTGCDPKNARLMANLTCERVLVLFDLCAD